MVLPPLGKRGNNHGKVIFFELTPVFEIHGFWAAVPLKTFSGKLNREKSVGKYITGTF